MTRSLLLLLTLLAGFGAAQDVLVIEGVERRRAPRQTIYVKDGAVVDKLTAAELKRARRVVDAHIHPGLVLADSGSLASLPADARAVNTGISAGDAYDPFTPRPSLVASGVTSAYVSPGRQRFVPGFGSVIAVGVDPLDAVAVGRSALHLVLTPEAYNPPDLFKPAIPPGPDNPHTVPERQFPRSRAGAFGALRQILDEAAAFAEGTGPASSTLPGQPSLGAFVEVLSGKRILRARVELAADIRALLDALRPHGSVRLVIEGGNEAWKVADAIAKAKAGVILRVGTPPSGVLPAPKPFVSARGESHPRAAAALRDAGVKVAVVPSRDGAAADLLWYAAQSGLGPAAIKAVTTDAAELIGLDAASVKDDRCVWDRHPLKHPEARPVVVIKGGKVIHDLTKHDRPIAILAKHVHTGKGEVIEDATVIVRGSKIVAVGKDLVIPNGARRVKAEAVMPGLIDAGGQAGFRSVADGGDAGLRPGKRLAAQSTSTRLSEMFDPTYPDVRPLAESGVTTVAITPSGGRGISGVLSIVKTSGDDKDACVVKEIGGLLVDMTQTGSSTAELKKVESAFKSGKKYKAGWDKYDKDFAEWKKKNPTAKAEKVVRARRVGKVKAPVLPDPLTGTWDGTARIFDGEDARLVISMRLKEEKVAGTIYLEGVLDKPIPFKDAPFVEDAFKIPFDLGGQKRRCECSLTEGGLSVMWYDGDTWGGFATLRRSSQLPSHEVVAPTKAKTDKSGGSTSSSKSKSKGPPKAPKEISGQEPFRPALDAEIPVFLGINDEAIAKKAIKLLRDEFECTTVVISAKGISKLGEYLSDNGCGFAPQGNPVMREAGKQVVTTLEAVRRGVPVALRSGWTGDGRTLYAAASHAVRCGVRPADAMKMVTYWSSLILNVADRVGAVAAGLDADLVILDGAPFMPSSRVERVMIDGRFLDERGGDN